MKVCHKEAMKRVKELEDKKERIINSENLLSSVTYKDGETPPKSEYSYSQTRKQIQAIDADIRRIKHELAKANCSVVIDGFDITLGEALVYLAQLNAELQRINLLADTKQTATTITANGVTVHCDCAYNVKTAVADAEAVNEKIGSLQVAIDRANLVNYIEI